MPCFRPMTVWPARGGGIQWNAIGALDDRPFSLPCGKCRGCRVRRKTQWAVRCMHEAQMHEQNCFLTLTYDQEHLPENGGLLVDDWQKFAKRLRNTKGSFRFLHCGEYGEKLGRPHYHAVIFGLDFDDKERCGTAKNGDPRWTSQELTKIWGKGNTELGEVSMASASYVASYTLAKVLGEKAEEHYRRVDTDTGEVFGIKPEYITMSLKPGIGALWWDKYKSDLFPSDECVIDGQKLGVPEYYYRKLEVEDPELFDEVQEKRIAKATSARNLKEMEWKRLRTREVHADLTAKQMGQRELD